MSRLSQYNGPERPNHHHWASLNLISERNCFMFQFMLIMFIIMFPSHSCFESNYSQLNFKQIIKFLNNLNILTCWMMWILLTHWTWPLFSVETQRNIIKNIIILIYKNLHGDDYLIFNSSSHCVSYSLQYPIKIQYTPSLKEETSQDWFLLSGSGS